MQWLEARTHNAALLGRTGSEHYLEPLLGCQLLFFCMSCLQPLQLLLCLASYLADVGVVLLRLLQLHLHLGQLLLKVV